MKVSQQSPHQHGVFFRICPKCSRAVPAHSHERYCVNDGQRLLEACPKCETRITNPYGRHCAVCGQDFSQAAQQD